MYPLTLAIAQIIHDYDVVFLSDQGIDEMASNKACATSDQDCFDHVESFWMQM
jgi:hypothetical protein